MHDSAFEKAQVFRRAYLSDYETQPLTVLDIGSAVVAEGHRSNREAMANSHWRYIGLDIEAAPNVDLVVAQPYDWREVEDASVDIVTCSQVFEHTEFFWITMLEIARVMKPNGLAFIVAPGSGPLHRYPVDCWRFYDDGLPALARWADLDIVESRVQWRPVYRKGNRWRDAAIVLQRPVRSLDDERKQIMKNRMVKAAHSGAAFEPGLIVDAPPPLSFVSQVKSQDSLARHEQILSARRSDLSWKISQAAAHLREIRHVLFSAKSTS